MPLTESQIRHLLTALESRGWQWHDGFIYAPHETMWLLGEEPWPNDLAEFHERMSARLQRNKQAGWVYDDKRDHQNLVDDTQSLVDVLSEMIGNL